MRAYFTHILRSVFHNPRKSFSIIVQGASKKDFTTYLMQVVKENLHRFKKNNFNAKPHFGRHRLQKIENEMLHVRNLEIKLKTIT